MKISEVRTNWSLLLGDAMVHNPALYHLLAQMKPMYKRDKLRLMVPKNLKALSGLIDMNMIFLDYAGEKYFDKRWAYVDLYYAAPEEITACWQVMNEASQMEDKQ